MPDFDFDLRGFFRLRLVDATEREATVVTRQIGPLRAPVGGKPDLTIRFVEPGSVPEHLRYIGLNEAAYSDCDFYLLKGKQKSTVRVQVPFDRLGDGAELVAERGINNIPLLIAMLNLSLLSKGILPFHASAFEYKGKGALVTGWAKGGKTEVLLSFMAQGASYIGDEWVYLLPDGSHMFGVPEPMRIWNWHLQDLPQFRARMKRKDQMRMRALGLLGGSLGALSKTVKGLGRARPIVQRQMYVHFPPRRLFGEQNLCEVGQVQRVIFAASHASPEITVQPVDPLLVAERMLHSLAEEQLPLLQAYWKYRFAFPERKNSWIETMPALQRQLLTEWLAGKQAVELLHPYPVRIPALFTALEPIFS